MYARGIGILYLRIVVDVKAIFDWIEPFLGDETEFSAAAESKRTTTFGEFVTQLFNEVLYCGQAIRRIPRNLTQQMEMKTCEREIIRERAEAARSMLRKGTKCKGKWNDGNEYDVTIDEVLSNGNFLVTYVDYGDQLEVRITDLVVDMDELASSSSSSRRRERSRSRDRDRNRSRSRDRGRRDRSRSRGRGSRDRDRSSRHGSSYSRDRDRGRSSRHSRDDRDASPPRPRRQLSLEEEVKKRMKEKLSRTRDRHVASDGNYAKLPTGYKKALGETVETVNRPRTESRN